MVDLSKTAHVFFQPARNVPALAAMGVNVFWGPSVENDRNLDAAALANAQQAWIAAVATAGAKCVLKLGTARPAILPAHCVGLLLTVDEPNGKSVLPATIKPEADALRAAYPGVPIYLSLTADKVTSANLRKPAELQLLADYLALADVVSLDWYTKNRNANRYPITLTGDAVKTVKAVRPDVKVVVWEEVNDQQLNPPPAPDVNREPTPDEIVNTWADALAKGADAPGFFLTAANGKYGWGDKGDGRGDSFWPMVNRAGASMAPQYAAMRRVARSVNPGAPDPAPVPDPNQQLADALRQLADARAQLAETAQELGDLRVAHKALAQSVTDYFANLDHLTDLRRALEDVAGQ